MARPGPVFAQLSAMFKSVLPAARKQDSWQSRLEGEGAFTKKAPRLWSLYCTLFQSTITWFA